MLNSVSSNSGFDGVTAARADDGAGSTIETVVVAEIIPMNKDGVTSDHGAEEQALWALARKLEDDRSALASDPSSLFNEILGAEAAYRHHGSQEQSSADNSSHAVQPRQDAKTDDLILALLAAEMKSARGHGENQAGRNSQLESELAALLHKDDGGRFHHISDAQLMQLAGQMAILPPHQQGQVERLILRAIEDKFLHQDENRNPGDLLALAKMMAQIPGALQHEFQDLYEALTVDQARRALDTTCSRSDLSIGQLKMLANQLGAVGDDSREASRLLNSIESDLRAVRKMPFDESEKQLRCQKEGGKALTGDDDSARTDAQAVKKKALEILAVFEFDDDAGGRSGSNGRSSSGGAFFASH